MNATIYGRISRDAELKDTNSGVQVARFGVALNLYKNGERSVTWVDATAFGKQAESLTPYLTKGSAVALAGDLALKTFDSRDGGSKTILEMSVNSISLLGAGGQEQTKPVARPAQNANTNTRTASRGGYQARPAPVREPGEDEDIGF
jgi:single-strand DNA-binding protein